MLYGIRRVTSYNLNSFSSFSFSSQMQRTVIMDRNFVEKENICLWAGVEQQQSVASGTISI